MYISMKYVVLYVGAGAATGWFSKGDRTASLIGLGVAALIGASFGISYAVVSAIEFGIGLGLATMLRKKQE
ncbi:hypothetical protein [Polynucleobacter sp. MWH-Aus1W21]|uniref:hypothetical protein n=1 Tax=Polynucleobacter sp. MWH-Aus1W21 TaxID=1855880 RepID=UPI001BFEE613|nr:hypothetical protein [Polynucleobacter sp. MWH-Aus1W21]QWD65936.1 hypothetical protein ICW03_09845 [Polynucleobacter sp. MWH-Aus1W21]